MVKMMNSENEDRDLPSVNRASESNNKMMIMGVIALVAALLLVIAFGIGSSDEPVEEKMTDKTNEEYSNQNVEKIKLPEIKEPAFEPVVFEMPVSAPVKKVPQLKLKPKLSDAELREIERKKQKVLARRASKMSVYSGKSEITKGEQEVTMLNRRKADLLDRLERMSAANSPTSFGGSGGKSKKIGDLLDSSSNEGVKATIMTDRTYKIGQGKMVSAVLETAIQSDLAGMVRAVITENIYSEDGRLLLLEKGSRAVGEYQGGLKQGQTRVFVIWSRIITPNGVDIAINSGGTGRLGRSGHSGQVDNHFFERFGSSMLLSVIGAYGAQEATSAANVELGENFNKSAEIALKNSINIEPTLHKNQGEYIKIFVARDLNFKEAYELRNR